jgi:hypothetical protein
VFKFRQFFWPQITLSYEIAYCYYSVIAIRFPLAQSNHIKRLPLYNKLSCLPSSAVIFQFLKALLGGIEAILRVWLLNILKYKSKLFKFWIFFQIILPVCEEHESKPDRHRSRGRQHRWPKFCSQLKNVSGQNFIEMKFLKQSVKYSVIPFRALVIKKYSQGY